MILLDILLIFMIVAALAAIEARNSLSAVIALGTVGLGLSLCFLLLHAPDLAVIILIVELITLTALVRVIRPGQPAVPGTDVLSAVAVILFAILFVAVGYRAVSELPAFGSPLLRLAREYLAQPAALTGTSNLVAGIALDFRALDSLAGILVLFLVVLGVMTIMSRRKGDNR